MRRRKRQPPKIIDTRWVLRDDGREMFVTVYEDTPVWRDPQPLRCKTKRTAKVCDPDIGQRPRSVQPARRA